MSTKTTIKRIALVAVSALGLGVVSTVPSSALVASVSSITVGTLSPVRAGQPVLIPITINTGAIAAANDTMTINAEITAAPTSGGLANAASVLLTAAATKGNTVTNKYMVFSDAAGNVVNTAENNSQTTAEQSTTNYSNQLVGGLVGRTFTDAQANAVGAAAVSVRYYATGTTDTANKHYLKVTPDLPGTYTVLISANVGTNTEYAAGDKSVAVTFTTGAAPSSIVLTTINGTTINGATYGSLIKVTLKDAAGAAAQLATNEVVSITPSSGTVSKWSQSAGAGSQGAYASSVSLSASDFINGAAWVSVKASASTTAASIVVTAAGSGLLSPSVTTTTTITSNPTDTTASEAVQFPSTAAAGVGAKAASTTYTTTVGYTVPTTSTSWSIGLTSTAATTANEPLYGTLTVTDTDGYLTNAGFTGLIWDIGYSASKAAAGEVAVTVTSALALASGKRFAINHGGEGSHVITGDAAVADDFTITPSSVSSATGATNTFKALLKDQYGRALANTAVTASVAGRNGAKVASSLVTDSAGYVTYSLTDSGTTGSSDVVTFTATATPSVTDNVTITYGTFTVGTVTLTGGNTSAGVTAVTPSIKDIDAASDGVNSTTYSYVALVKDANGNLLSGIPVSFTLDKTTGAAFTTTTQTVYSGTDGKATAYIYGWTAGTYTVTATAGGKTGTGTITFAQVTNSGEERSISAALNANIVTATVKDRLGNPVPGVNVYATQAGGATINGKTKDFVATDSNGQADFVIAGTGDITVSTIDYRVVGAKGSGQTCARAGAIDCNDAAADDTTFTDTVAGTTLVNAKYVGSSFAAAGVASATVSASATTSSEAVDAANEATDAANAATDAANAAAEAADAATAAAQDAQAAVAELATKVASLIAGIKAQITTLTNLVIKIQKKVRA